MELLRRPRYQGLRVLQGFRGTTSQSAPLWRGGLMRARVSRVLHPRLAATHSMPRTLNDLASMGRQCCAHSLFNLSVLWSLGCGTALLSATASDHIGFCSWEQFQSNDMTYVERLVCGGTNPPRRDGFSL